MPGNAPYRASSRFVNFGIGLLYSIAFVFGYFLFLNPHFGYAGFTLLPDINLGFVGVSLLISAAPVLLYSGVRAISSLVAVFIYLFIYTTTILTLSLAMYGPKSSVLLVQLTFALAMSMIFLADRPFSATSISIHTNANVFPWLLAMTFLMSAIMAYSYRGSLKFVDYEDVYEQRFANLDLGKGLFIRYGSSWLANCMIPLCLAYGILHRRPLYSIIGAGACVLIYMATAAKSVVLFPVVFYGLYVLLKKERLQRAYQLLAVTLVAIMLISLCFDFNVMSSLFWMRSVGNGGFMTLHYLNFFSDHPYTLYSHINLVNMIFGYSPYEGDPIGVVVGRFFMSEDTSANAHFWATDGIAAGGLLGVLFVTAVLFGALILTNAITRRHDKLFLVLAFLPFLVTLLNLSLFTAIWSGGGFFLVLFFAMIPTMRQEFSADETKVLRKDLQGRRPFIGSRS